MQFSFKTDEESHAFCGRVVQAMELLFDIPIAEGVALLNEHWHGQDFTEVNPHGWLIHHETEAYWASCIVNPHPYVEGEPTQHWQTVEDEAERRIGQFRASHTHDWLYY
ncbi:hypothetical protein [Gemmata sp.]|uniref:hypothetical protein n=1 Tax=Gemmata sp. TaxID=1914242 RepID=UPI003F7091C8